MAISALKNYVVYIDGIGYAGKVEQGNPPKITLKTEEFMGAGMLAAIDISMDTVEKMTFDVTLVEHNPVIESLFGQSGTAVTFRGVAGEDNTAVIIETKAMIKEVDPGTWEAGKKGSIKIGLTASYYKKTVGGDPVLEIDAENFIFNVGGSDLLANMRSALGLA